MSKKRGSKKLGKIPSEHRLLTKGKKSAQAEEEIRERLEEIKVELENGGIDARVRVHRYRDGSVDGEVLANVPRGVSADQLAMDIEHAAGRKGMGGFWINMGTRFTIEEDEEVYRRFRGYNDVNTHYQRATPGNWSEIPLIVRKQIIKGMEKKYGRKAHSVYLRIHWNRHGAKPRNRG